ncbi:glutamine--fructose-6-phosphate aminotransferase [isomerizing] [Alphaproteobacteria bacterium]|nr:glutamine--fructose-6-phosphate aminotransferase [isomerizing] [Alphaproteobacteria bacterium]
MCGIVGVVGKTDERQLHNEIFFARARKNAAQDRSVLDVHEDPSSGSDEANCEKNPLCSCLDENVLPLVLDGLTCLEYRGYDSAGIALVHQNSILRVRAVGKLSNLQEKLRDMDRSGVTGSVGIGHTRWATHGKPTESNAHPMMSRDVAVVHNGIIENHKELRSFLENDGYMFTSETDTEVIAHLLQRELSRGFSPLEAMKNCIEIMDGTFAIAAVFSSLDDKIIVARRKSSLAVGFVSDSKENSHMCVGSDVGALSCMCDEVAYLEDNDIAEISRKDAVFYDKNLNKVERKRYKVLSDGNSAEKGAYPHFMLKEIMDQPSAIRKTIQHMGIYDDFLQHKIGASIFDNVRRILIIACGTSYHAGMVAKYWFERFLKIPTNVEIASEFRYRSPVIEDNTLLVSISQSGETLDTLAAIEYAKSNGNCKTVGIVNVKNSAIDRASEIVFHSEAGMEVGVASTKCFSAQLIILACLAFCKNEFLLGQLQNVPAICEEVLTLSDEIKQLAEIVSKSSNAIYLGRGTMFPIALEGALKLKEISYIHAEGFAAGEMKHGPIALIDDQVPIILLCPHNELFEKTASNLQEALARGKNVIVVTDVDGEKLLPKEVRKLVLPSVHSAIAPVVYSAIAPIIYSIPLQLLAYHVAIILGTDVDRPRNLAKSVTVE